MGNISSQNKSGSTPRSEEGKRVISPGGGERKQLNSEARGDGSKIRDARRRRQSAAEKGENKPVIKQLRGEIQIK